MLSTQLGACTYWFNPSIAHHSSCSSKHIFKLPSGARAQDQHNAGNSASGFGLTGWVKLATVPAWKDYQEETAAYYCGLGLSAETDVTLEGARGRHDVDVVVRGYRAGVDFLWIVECKYWNRPVSKATVATLVAIVQDVGADRGLLLSRRGFQAGATALAHRSNITLTSLSELQANTADEYIEFQCELLTKRCQAAIDTISARTIVTRHSPNHLTASDPPGCGYVSYEVRGRISMIEQAIQAAVEGKWPIDLILLSPLPGAPADYDFLEEMAVQASNMDELAHWIGIAMDLIEIQIGLTTD
jgi:Restriction endonuclease